MVRTSVAILTCLVGVLACASPHEVLGPIPPGAPDLAPDQTLCLTV